MKKLNLFFAVIIAVGLIGCDLLDQQPQQSLPVDEIVNAPDGIQDLVTGLYDGLQNPNISGANFNVLPEIMADNVTWSGSFVNYARQADRAMLPSDPQVQGWWNVSYREINTANLLLRNVVEIDDPTFTEDDRDLILGEAHFARGVLYFELARAYAKPWGFTADNSHDGVAVRTTPVEGVPDFENLSRAPLSEVFELVEQDLIAAANLLPDTGLRSDRRATRYAALGYLMRLELEKGDYAAAADYAGQIITSGEFSLTSSPAAPFENEFSSESIFEIVHTSQDNPGVNAGQNAFYASTNRGGRGDIQYSSAFFTALNSTVSDDQQAAIDAADYNVVDLRSSLIDPATTSTVKFPDGTNNADNVINMRLADILLARAEALVETSATIVDVPLEAYDLLNEVRRRSIVVTDDAGNDFSELIEYNPGDFATTEEMIDAILLERRVELAFEGDRFHTLKRKGLDVRGLPFDDNRLTFPIPQDEIDANPNMEQNDGY
jgi:starch-binding outer membrane protein, SusD/RagB family